MLTPGVGLSSISPSTGTITVTDRPEVIELIASYLEDENKRITRQVLLNVKVLSVTVSDSDSVGINWNMVYNSLDKFGIGLSTAFTGGGGASESIGILNPSSRWTGSYMLIDALSSRSEDRRGGKESVSKCRYRWSRDH